MQQLRGAAVSAPAMRMPVDTAGEMVTRVELSAPLSGTQGPIAVLELREATFGDFLDCGPIQRNIAMDPRGEGAMRVEVVEDAVAVMRWMCRLTGQPEAVLRTMRPRDAFALRREIARVVAGFELGNSPAAPTSSFSSAA